MLINFVNMFQIIYKGFKCRLTFVQSVFLNKRFWMLKISQNLHLFLFSHRVLTERMWDCLKIYRNKNSFLLLTSQTCPKRTVCIREQEFLLALFSCQAMVLLSELALGSRC